MRSGRRLPAQPRDALQPPGKEAVECSAADTSSGRTPCCSTRTPLRAGIIYIVLASPFLLSGGAGWKVYKRIGRALSRKAGYGAALEESGADFFLGAPGCACMMRTGSRESSRAAQQRCTATMQLVVQAACTLPPLLLRRRPTPLRLPTRRRRAGQQGVPCGGQEHPGCRWVERQDRSCCTARHCLPLGLTTCQVAAPPPHPACRLPALPRPHPSGLRSLDGQYVTSVRRGDSIIHAVGAEFVLAAGDILFLSGAPSGQRCCQRRMWQRCSRGHPTARLPATRQGQPPAAPPSVQCTAAGLCLESPLVTTSIRCPPLPPPLPGIPDGTDKLAKLGLVPFSDALEEVQMELPAFGVSSIAGEPAAPLRPGRAQRRRRLQQAVPASPAPSRQGRPAPPPLPAPPALAVPHTSPLKKQGSDEALAKASGGSQPEAAGVSPPELVEAVIKKGAAGGRMGLLLVLRSCGACGIPAAALQRRCLLPTCVPH